MTTSSKFTPKVKQLGKSEQSRIKLSFSLAKEGRLAEAMAELEALLEENPSSFSAHVAIGNLLYRQKAYDEALSHYQKAIQIEPKKPQAILKAGVTYLRKNEADKATAQFQNALKVSPKAHQAFVGLGQAFVLKEKYEEAVQQCRKALMLNPRLNQARQVMAQAYVKMGKLDDATAELKTAINYKADNFSGYAQLGRIYLTQQDYGAAREALEEALKLKPEAKPGVRLGLVQALIAEEKLGEATETLKQVNQSNRLAPIVHKLWGDIYTAQGLTKEAAEEYRAATLLAKEGDGALEELDMETVEDIDWEEMADSYRESATSLVASRLN
ncbi:lipopolysaccharide assembly protein LapB [Candidatus Cyanaurora vandensis]|uniref:tetratricopeptide repeat protein n=1 Tax=Candidatus Cyanaurora vandensis TaxID=2714958 RepID=UPI00257E699A|nr:tetratricopeptide repeat protein [Candidatus Cyanaurora vandensis]